MQKKSPFFAIFRSPLRLLKHLNCNKLCRNGQPLAAVVHFFTIPGLCFSVEKNTFSAFAGPVHLASTLDRKTRVRPRRTHEKLLCLPPKDRTIYHPGIPKPASLPGYQDSILRLFSTPLWPSQSAPFDSKLFPGRQRPSHIVHIS